MIHEYKCGDNVTLKNGVQLSVIGPCAGYASGEMGPHWIARVTSDPSTPPFRHAVGSTVVFTPSDVKDSAPVVIQSLEEEMRDAEAFERSQDS